MIPQDIKDEIRQDMLREAHEDEAHERKLRNDEDYATDIAIDNFDIEESISNIRKAIEWLKSLGYEDVEAKDLLDLY